mmetsp:Transcript_93826/g.251067  ORF Transcript_93826/g.251067 Transcript_93826/m.251067 type:complete len:392 (+) Transcript_93826:36-1211(+)
MPRAEVGTPKWVANKMKAKGLTKLRWYCQMCEKACRDENGFKCHRMSEGHQRMMAVFCETPGKFMDSFSREFESGFMQIMSTKYCQTRVLANTVYCEFIADRHHTHMNSTIWVTLSNFVQYLARTGKCKIDQTPKGWYLTYIDNSPEAAERRRKAEEQGKIEVTEHEAKEKKLQRLVQEFASQGRFEKREADAIGERTGDSKVEVGFKRAIMPAVTLPETPKAGNVLENAFEPVAKKAKLGTDQGQKRMSTLDKLMLENEKIKKAKLDVADWWVSKGCIVKVMHKDLADGKYFKKKGEIVEVHDNYKADVKMIETGDLIRLDERMLETVIPKVGGPVRIVKGDDGIRECDGTLQAVDMEKLCCTVALVQGGDKIKVEGLTWDAVCKLATPM